MATLVRMRGAPELKSTYLFSLYRGSFGNCAWWVPRLPVEMFRWRDVAIGRRGGVFIFGYWLYIRGMLKDNFKSVGREHFGATEDEWSNFLIDCWATMNQRGPGTTRKFQYFDASTGEVVERDTPISITITLKNKD